MEIRQITSFLEKAVPIALFTGLVADWFRLRLSHRAEERKHIARVISDLLELRYLVKSLPDFPSQVAGLLPKELRDQVPTNLWRCINFAELLPRDDELANRYRKTVDEIAGFRPFLAFQLRGKERYFDLRNVISRHFSQAPGSPLVASRITEVLDRECLPMLDETLLLLAGSHSLRMRFSIKCALRRRGANTDLVPAEFRKVIEEQIRMVAVSAASRVQATAPSTESAQNSKSQP